MAKQPTRDDVARLAGTSTAVVSYVVNGGPRNVRPETRKRVLEAIEHLGYRPNASAQSLSRGRSDLFALLVPDLANPYLAELAQRLEEEFFRRDMVLVVGDSHDDQDRESTILEAFRRQQIAGLAWYGVTQPLPLDLLEDASFPVVLLNEPDGQRMGHHPRITRLVADEQEAARIATEHLLQHGRTRVAMVAGPKGRHNARERIRGWRLALRQAGLDEGVVINGPFTRTGGVQAAQALIDSGADAVVVSNELQATGLLRELHCAGVGVPEDIALIALNGTALSEFLWPPVTSVDVPVSSQAEAIADFVTGTDRARDLSVTSRLTKRASCGCSYSSKDS